MATGGPDYNLELPPGGLILTGPASTNFFLSASVAGDTVARFTQTFSGKQAWGPGNAAQDVNLQRSGLYQLKINGGLLVDGGGAVDPILDVQIGADTSTGIRLLQSTTPGADCLRIETRLGATVTKIDSAGRVGIKTGSGALAAPLQVNQGVDLNLHCRTLSGVVGIAARNDANSANAALEFQASEFHLQSGSVGIGVSPPTQTLDVAGNIRSKRLITNQGTALVAADFALSAGWGAAASVAVTSGSTDQRGKITVTAAGLGQGANPNIRLTFKDGAWPGQPFALVKNEGGTGTIATTSEDTSATFLDITYIGTPNAGFTYAFNYLVLG